MKNIVKGSVALLSLLAGAALVGTIAQARDYSDVDRAVTLSGDPGETMVATQTGNVINLPEMVITGELAAPKLLPFHPEKCAELVKQFGSDADYRCPRHSHRSAPTGGRSHASSYGTVQRTFVHTLSQGGSPEAPTVIVHEYQDAE